MGCSEKAAGSVILWLKQKGVPMALSNITVQLDSDAAKIYRMTPPKEQAKIRLLFSILLREFADSARTLEAIMDEIGERAEALGLTEDKLQALLDAR